MEVFNATDHFAPEENPFKRKLRGLVGVIRSLNKKQWLGVVGTFILVISIFITLGLTQQVQKFFSQAFSQPGSYGYGDYGAGKYSLGSISPPPSASPSASPSVPPSTSPSPSPSLSPSPSASLLPSPSTGVVNADIDGNGVINIQDYNAFVGYFKAKDPKADINHSGAIDIFDYNDLLLELRKAFNP